MDCACDYDPPIFFSEWQPVARKAHKCDECGGQIQPGEKYERCSGMWERGEMQTFKVCARCLELRNYVQAHVPCFCWAYGNIIDDAIETAQHWAHEAPGLLFGAYRRRIAIQRQRATA